MDWLPQRTNAAVPWTPLATPTTSTASTVLATPMSSVGSTSSQLSTATVERPPPAVALQTARPTPAQVANVFGTWGRGRRKDKKSRRKIRNRRKTRRGGTLDAPGTIPVGMQCVFPTESDTKETRKFQPRELVCYIGPVDGITRSGWYDSTRYRTSANVAEKHLIQKTLDNLFVSVEWKSVGKLV